MAIPKEQLSLDNVKQYYIRTTGDKASIINDVLKKIASTSIIIFVNTRRYAESIFLKLREYGHSIGLIMGGDMSMEERSEVLKMFKKGKFNILITTNLLARGFDNRHVQLVVNLDVPKKYNLPGADCEAYLHRVGRTGRFGDCGVALSIIDDESDFERINEIGEHYEKPIPEINDLDKLAERVKAAEKMTLKARKAMMEDDL